MKASIRLLPMLFTSFLIAAGGSGVAITSSAAQVGIGADIDAAAGASAKTAVSGVAGSAAVGGQGAVSTQAQGSTGSNARGQARSGERMSTRGQANQNAQGRAGATKGLERAKERTSPQGLDHAKSLEAEGNAAGSARTRTTSR